MRHFGLVIAASSVLLMASACKSKSSNDSAGTAGIENVDVYSFKETLKSLRDNSGLSALALASAFHDALKEREGKARFYTPVANVEKHFCIDEAAATSIKEASGVMRIAAEDMSKRVSAALEACTDQTTCANITPYLRPLLDAKAGIHTASVQTDAYLMGADMGDSLDDMKILIASAYDQVDDWILAHNYPVDRAYEMDVNAFEYFSDFFKQQAETARWQSWNEAPFADDISQQLSNLAIGFQAMQELASLRISQELTAPESYASVSSRNAVDVLAQLDALSVSIARAAQAAENCDDSLIFQIGRTNGLIVNLDRTIVACLESGVCHNGDADVTPLVTSEESGPKPDLAERIDAAAKAMQVALNP